MDIYYKFEQIFENLIQNGWHKTITKKGLLFTSSENDATGYMAVYGDINKACFLDADVTFNAPVMEMLYFKERGIQITLVEDMDVTYYHDKSDIENARFGIFCYVNNVPMPWFKIYPKGTKQCALTIRITESFFEEVNISMTHSSWDQLGQIINQRKITVPGLAYICREIKQSKLEGISFELFFKAKVIEAISLLIDYAEQCEKDTEYRITEKTRMAVKKALNIINDNYVSPPIISDLAIDVGINKKTLQQAFQLIVGESIHKYVRALKMQRAIMLLDVNDKSIDDISKLVGYNSKIHFYNAFKSTFNCTPHQMRKKILQGKK